MPTLMPTQDIFINMGTDTDGNLLNNELWRNEGGGVFDLQTTVATALAVDSVGSAWGDVDGVNSLWMD